MNPYLGEIRQVAFNFVPIGWLACDGSLLPINQYTALFAVLGVTYGGDGKSNFALPNLNGRMAMHADNLNYPLGSLGGEQTVTLTQGHLPAHTHTLSASSDLATLASPANALLAAKPRGGHTIYAANSGLAAALAPTALQSSGGSQSHSNLQPSLYINFIIAVAGIFPSRA